MTPKLNIDRLLTDVLARLGETARPLPPSADAGGWADVAQPEDVIALKVRASLPEVGARLIREAPPELLGGGASAAPPQATRRLMPCGLYAAEVRLPDDFLRLAGARMAGWRHGVGAATPPGDPQWGRQWSAEPAIAGCAERPRAYLDSDSGGLLLRLLGSGEEDADVDFIDLWSTPTLTEAGDFLFPPGLYPELVAALAAEACKS